ncbi:MAG: glutamate--tRNA ligase [Candidatus Levybacteria bacterium]|nr:glutamate--tRNA ligase [Candidatus Levybacteria bacterium]
MSEKKQTVRTRIAPSPTGYPHIGTIYQTLFDFAFARKNSGQFLVRIEDTDRERFVPDAEEKLFAALDWFGLEENESPRKVGDYGPYRQSERLGIYQKYAKELLTNGHAYYCFCTRERLENMRKKQQEEKKIVMYDKHCRTIPPEVAEKRVQNTEPHVIRMKIPEDTKLTYKDAIRGEITVDSNSVDDQVILKSDGFPTYHLAVVVDDHLMKITHVLRGPEWLSSTPKHFLLYDYFGWERPLFFHTPLLSNPDHSKLSKRHGHTNVSWYQENGYLPEAILNFLALLGWSHPEGKEIFPLQEFIQYAELKDLKPVAPIFDLTKLTWMNQQYIQNLSNTELKKRLKARFSSLSGANEDLLDKLIPLVRTRMETLRDFENLTVYFFSKPSITLSDEREKKVAEDLKKSLTALSDWNKDTIFAVFKGVMERHSVRMPLLYKILTGKEKGLPLPESLAIVGKKEALSRL